MRKKLYTAALMAGLALPLALATPAQAHPVYAYHGADRAWTNTAHTRVGVEDRERVVTGSVPVHVAPGWRGACRATLIRSGAGLDAGDEGT